MNLERYRQYRKMSLDITKSQIDSQLSNADIYPEATKLSIAKVLLEWNQNNNVRKSASNIFHLVCLNSLIYNIVKIKSVFFSDGKFCRSNISSIIKNPVRLL